jgi:hypothetical protein
LLGERPVEVVRDERAGAPPREGVVDRIACVHREPAERERLVDRTAAFGRHREPAQRDRQPVAGQRELSRERRLAVVEIGCAYIGLGRPIGEVALEPRKPRLDRERELERIGVVRRGRDGGIGGE